MRSFPRRALIVLTGCALLFLLAVGAFELGIAVYHDGPCARGYGRRCELGSWGLFAVVLSAIGASLALVAGLLVTIGRRSRAEADGPTVDIDPRRPADACMLVISALAVVVLVAFFARAATYE